MTIIKQHKWFIIPSAIVLIAIGTFVGMYQKDMSTLTGFASSYERFDKAMSAFSTSDYEEIEHEAVNALIDLTKRAIAFQLSSLIKNDNVLDDVAREIGTLSGTELEMLKAYKIAKTDAALKMYHEVENERREAYRRFRELGDLER